MFKPERIFVSQPPMGGKAHLIERPGLFVLEVGPGTLITDACTHAGGGAIVIIDGVPDANGHFDDVAVPAPDSPPEVFDAWGKRNGREYFRANPVVMGSWMLNAGFHNGLTVHVTGAHQGLAPIATLVWTAFRARG
jgi:hypothetical protein